MIHLKIVEISHIPHKGTVEKLFYRSLSGNHVHCLPAQEMHETALDLSRASGLIRTERLCLLLILDKRCSAVRTVDREVRPGHICGSLTEFHSRDLRDDLAAFLHIDIVTDMNVKLLHLIGIMKRGTLDDSTAELHRFKIGHRSDRTGSSDLIVY